MKQKTAIRQLIENSLNKDLVFWRIELEKANQSDNGFKQALCDARVKLLEKMIKEAESLEPVNEQQIKDAYIRDDSNYVMQKHSAEIYFKETFGRIMEESVRSKDTIYTYYKIRFINCDNIGYDYTIVESLDDIRDYLQAADEDLDNPELKAKVVITGVGMTAAQYEKWFKKNVESQA